MASHLRRRRSVALILPSIAPRRAVDVDLRAHDRIAIVDQLGNDYVRAARAASLSRMGAVGRHVLRNAAIPVVDGRGAPRIGNLLAGAVIVETVFAWPGIGLLAIQSIQSRDFLVVQVVVLFISIVYVRHQPGSRTWPTR